MADPLTPDDIEGLPDPALWDTDVSEPIDLARRLLATVDAEREARTRAETRLADVDQRVRGLHLMLPLDLTEYGVGRRDVLNEIRALLDAPTTDTPCPTCVNGMVPVSGLGGDGFDPCPDCTDTPEADQ